MRVTNRASTRNYLKYVNKAQSDMQGIMHRIDSGNRFERISEDVSSGVSAMKAQTELYKAKEHYNNVKTIDETLTSAEDAMTSINDSLVSVYEKVQKALNGTNDVTNRKILAQEIGALKEQIMQLANTKYAGQYLFSGSNNYGAPFTVKDGNLQYNGIDVDSIKKRDDGTYYYEGADGTEVDVPLNDDVYLDIGLGIKMTGPDVDPQTGFDISFAGPDILGFGVDENGISNNLYNLLSDIQEAISEDPMDTSKAGELENKLIARRDEFSANVTDIGAKTQFLETMMNRLEKNANNLDSKLARLTGTDMTEEFIHQSTNKAVTNALYQLGSQVVPLSLMDFIR